MTPSTKVLSPRNAVFLLAVTRRIAPPVADLPESEQAKIIQTVDETLGKRDGKIQKQFNLFLKVLRLSTIIPYGKSMDRLSDERMDQKLRRFQDHPIEKMRLGFWGMKTMVYMGFYGDPERYASFSYQPSLHGNEKLDD